MAVDPVGLMMSEVMGGIASLGSAYQESLAIKEQGKYDQFVHETNAMLLRMRAEDAFKRGELDVLQRARTMHELEGAQRAAYASQGVDVTTGTPAAVQRETRERAYQDILMIRENASREAFGMKVEAMFAEGSARMARAGAKAKARATMSAAFTGLAKDALKAGLMYDKYKVPDSKSVAGPAASGGVPKGYTDDIDYLIWGTGE
jgi:hypothetical protein